MKLGICTSFDNLEKAAAMGFDYIEVGVGSVASLSDEDFRTLKEKLSDKPIGVEAANVMLPGPFHVTGKEADHNEIREFLSKAFPRLSEIGCRVVVFGSGGARKVPEGFSMDKAKEQMIDACRMIGDIAGENGITIALEPLNRSETNIINSVSEGGEMVEQVNHPAFKLLADYYHIGVENEGLDGVRRYGKELHHVHIANPVTRTVPCKNDRADYREFFDVLKSASYEERVSFEGRMDDFDQQMPAMISFFRPMMI